MNSLYFRGILYWSFDAQRQYGLGLMVLSWASTEIPRYFFYAWNVISPATLPSILTYIRYSTFLILYPTGITGEVFCILASLPYFKSHPKVLSYYMPNDLNFEIKYLYVLYAILAIYVPGSYYMYTYMLGQRRKALGGGSKSSLKKTE
jgi:very-long-chain (3R)-3-hydroxyacyl-CoA dehydratase